MISLDIEIRKLNLNKVSVLCDILDKNNSWKKLMNIIPTDLEAENCTEYKYSGESVELIERASEQQNRSCTAILFDEWGTSGKVRPQLSHLRQLLIKTELFRAADFVSELLQVRPPERPQAGPAARVEIPDTHQLPKKEFKTLPSFVLPTPPLPSYRHKESQDFFTSGVDQHSNVVEETYSVQDTQPCPYNIEVMLFNGNEAVDLPFRALAEVTNNFSEEHMLGKGSCGTVYLGKVSGGHKEIAIKRLHDERVPGGAYKQFRNEISAISRIKHPNLLTLLGFSTDGDSLCLVYPFMPKGSLSDMLETEDNRRTLIWNLRLEIARGVAKGIAHLHGLEPQPLIHRDIKTPNILLDDNMVPKLCDFGLVRASSSDVTNSTALTTTIIGTSVYMASEAFRGIISVKMDVFSFGVVLLELLTGSPPVTDDGPLVDTIFDQRTDSSSTSEFLMDKLVDSLAGDWGGDWRNGIPRQFLQVALDCIAADKNSRPHIATVVEQIENIINGNIT